MNEITFSVKPEYAPMAVNCLAMYLLLEEFCSVMERSLEGEHPSI